MPSSYWQRLAALAVFLGPVLVGLALAGPASAAPPPRPVCATCGDAFEQSADEYGLAVDVTNSTATVVVHENGTATWVVRNEIRGEAALERLQANRTLRTEIAEGRNWDATLRAVAVSANGTVTARYRDPGFADRAVGGTLRSSAFTEAYGYGNLDGLGADRLVVVAPVGMQVGATVPGATVSGTGDRMTLTRFERGGFVTFVPASRALAPLWSLLAIGQIVGPVAAVNAAVGVAVPAGIVGLFVAVAGRFRERAATVTGWLHERIDLVLVGGGGAGIVLALASGALSALGTSTVPLFGGGVATLALGAVHALAPVDRPSYRRVAAGALAATAVAVLAAIAAAPLFYGRIPWQGITATLPVLAAFAFAPAGFALARGRGRLAVGTAVVAAVAAAVIATPLFRPVRIFGLSFRLVLAAVDAVVFTAAGLPFLIVGAALADDTAPQETD